jgi:aminoglycoside phosphotransferase (APT) family kinase protein
MRTLERRVAAHRPGGPLALPRAVSYTAANGLLLQERIAGIPYADLLAGPRGLRYLELAGAALAALHGLPQPPRPAKRLAGHTAELMRPHPALVAARWPEARARIEALTAELERRAAGQARTAPVAWLHRDFHVKQLIARQGRVCVIDWDLAASGDPALDVGNFLLNLEKHLGARADEGRRAFVEGYLRLGEVGAVRRAVLYEAFNCLRRACKAFRAHGRQWRRDALERLAAAEGRLHAL